MSTAEAERIIAALGLAPHPEGGFYRETFRDSAAEARRPTSTSIYYLLRRGEVSRWHRIDAVEIWHWYAGAPLRLRLAPRERAVEEIRLGNDILAGERPQAVVPAHIWQSAVSLGAWSLAGCTVAPGFEFQAFELAPPGWEPGGMFGS